MAEPSKSLPQALLSVTEGTAKPAQTNLSARQTITLGRGAECDVVLKDVKASRQHCKLTRSDTAFILEDLGSKNGTYVEGKRITEPVSLKPNQSFKVGDTVLYLA